MISFLYHSMFIDRPIYSNVFYYVQIGHILYGKIINNGFLRFEQYLLSIASR